MTTSAKLAIARAAPDAALNSQPCEPDRQSQIDEPEFPRKSHFAQPPLPQLDGRNESSPEGASSDRFQEGAVRIRAQILDSIVSVGRVASMAASPPEENRIATSPVASEPSLGPGWGVDEGIPVVQIGRGRLE